MHEEPFTKALNKMTKAELITKVECLRSSLAQAKERSGRRRCMLGDVKDIVVDLRTGGLSSRLRDIIHNEIIRLAKYGLMHTP